MVNTADFSKNTRKCIGGTTEKDFRLFRTAKYCLKTSNMGMDAQMNYQ